MTIHVDELEIVVIIDEEEVLASRRIEPFSIRLGQGHAGFEAAPMTVVGETRVFALHAESLAPVKMLKIPTRPHLIPNSLI